MTRIFGMAGTMVVALLFAVETIPAQPGVLVEADNDTVMKIHNGYTRISQRQNQ